jgi:hypothetical protein
VEFKNRLNSSQVYVDATISNMQDQNLPHEAYVGYTVEMEPGKRNAKRINATQPDEAEAKAILFAIEELEKKLPSFEIWCDHESVVSEINRPPKDYMPKSKLLQEIRSKLQANDRIKLKLFEPNPAHRYLKEYLRNKEQVQ